MIRDKKVALVTGSTDGVGRYVAARLANAGVHVIVHGRDRMRAERLVDEIHEAGGTAQYYLADFAALAAVRALAESVIADHCRLDVLINNAGIGAAGRYGGRHESRDGYELRFAVNYLAGFLLTRRLLPLLRDTGNARIVNVSSVGQMPIDFADVLLTRGYSGARAYCQSKLAQIMFTIDLAEELAGTGIAVNALHPATYMDTSMVRADGISPVSTVAQGGDAILQLAVLPPGSERTGRYFDGMTTARAHPQAYDTAARARLRRLSLDWAGLAPAPVEV
jgi:NAD(P)-dependent dehydrogenase (short-subunit alcohol dehydrogenase family)